MSHPKALTSMLMIQRDHFCKNKTLKERFYNVIIRFTITENQILTWGTFCVLVLNLHEGAEFLAVHLLTFVTSLYCRQVYLFTFNFVSMETKFKLGGLHAPEVLNNWTKADKDLSLTPVLCESWRSVEVNEYFTANCSPGRSVGSGVVANRWMF